MALFAMRIFICQEHHSAAALFFPEETGRSHCVRQQIASQSTLATTREKGAVTVVLGSCAIEYGANYDPAV